MLRTLMVVTVVMFAGAKVSAAELQEFEVSEQRVATEFRLDGRIEAVNQATVSAQTSGRIVGLPYDVDDFVEAGAVIVRFRDTEQKAALERARAGLKEAVARNEQAQTELGRLRGLLAEGGVSQSHFDRAKAEAESARARLASARAAVETAREQLEHTRVRAPYAGIVTARHVEEGELAQPGQPLMSGLSLEQLRVVVDVPQRLVGSVRNNADVSVISPDGKRIAARVSSIFPFADEATHTFRLRAGIPEHDAALFPGMLVSVVFATGERSAILVPANAVARRGEVRAVYVAQTGRVLVFRQVRTGRSRNGMTEILAGLRPGERIVTDPVAAAVQVKSAGTSDE